MSTKSLAVGKNKMILNVLEGLDITEFRLEIFGNVFTIWAELLEHCNIMKSKTLEAIPIDYNIVPTRFMGQCDGICFEAIAVVESCCSVTSRGHAEIEYVDLTIWDEGYVEDTVSVVHFFSDLLHHPVKATFTL